MEPTVVCYRTGWEAALIAFSTGFGTTLAVMMCAWWALTRKPG